MTQLLVVTSPRQMLLLAAAIDHGALPPAPHGRVVVLADVVPVPETGPELAANAALRALARRTDRIVSWTATIAPLRPATFVPRRDEQPVWERLLREHWQLGDGPVTLVLTDPAQGPGRALTRVLPHARLTLVADRLERWAPPRTALRDGLPARVDALVAPELLPGLLPHAYDEHGTRTVLVPARRLVDVVVETARDVAPSLSVPDRTARSSGTDGDGTSTALLIVDAPEDLGHDGDDPAPMGAGGPGDLGTLAERLAELAAIEIRDVGLDDVTLVVHPRATPTQVRRTVRTLRAAHLDVTMSSADVPAEVVIVRDAPSLVVGTASTALVTALALGARDVRAVGTAEVLDALTPYHHPARTALTVTDRLLATGPEPSTADVVRLVEAVTYVMHPDRVPHLRPAAVAVLTSMQGTDDEGRPPWRRWIRRRRVERLRLVAAPHDLTTHGSSTGPSPSPLPPAPAPVPTSGVPQRGRRLRSALRLMRAGDAPRREP